MSSLIKIKSPEFTEELAEFVGIMLGDGSIFVGPNDNQVRITGNSITEADYVTRFVKNLMSELFGIVPHIRFPKGKNAVIVYSDSKNLVEFLRSIGLKSGDKIRNKLGIPAWIKSDNKLLASCIRGLVDTDGSISRLKPHWPNLLQISFKNNNSILLNDFRESLIALGFIPSKIFGNRVVLTRKAEIQKYFKEIGSNRLKIAL